MGVCTVYVGSRHYLLIIGLCLHFFYCALERPNKPTNKPTARPTEQVGAKDMICAFVCVSFCFIGVVAVRTVEQPAIRVEK